MKLHKYRSYRQYVRIQSRRNKRQLDTFWANPDVLDAVAAYVKEHIPGAAFGICHGAKHGFEVQQLKNRLGVEVIGTDISKTAKKFEGVIQWDFHEVKDEWRNNTDFIYSNSLDHSFDPEMCIDRWMSCIKGQGCCFIEWSEMHGEPFASKADTFGASEEEYRALLEKRYRIRAVLEVPANEEYQFPVARKIFVVGHRPA